MEEPNLNEIPYAEWLENALQEMIKFPVKGICMYAVMDNGDIYNNYHNISMADKILISGYIQQDAMLDTMTANGMIEKSDGEEDE